MRVFLFILLIALTITSCGDRNPADSGGGTGTVIIECQLEPEILAKTAVLKPTTKADISVYDSQNNPIVDKKSLTVSGTAITGSLQVKAGSGYRVELFCYDSDNTVTHSGTASNVRVGANEETLVTINLKPAKPDSPNAFGPTSTVKPGAAYSISWDEVSRAKSYTIEEAANSSFSNATSQTIVGLSTSFTKSSAQTYYYRIKANNSTGSSGWSNTVIIAVEPPIDILFVSFPGGTFQMRDEVGDIWDTSLPVHTVTVSSFEMSTYEVTNAQYAKYLKEALASGDVTATSTSVNGAKGMYSGQEYIYLAGY